MNILVIEDEPKVTRAICQGLESVGYQVTAAATGEEGYFLATTHAFDLVVLDLMLPGRSGLEILDALRRQKCDARVLILTARDTVEDRVLGLDANRGGAGRASCPGQVGWGFPPAFAHRCWQTNSPDCLRRVL